MSKTEEKSSTNTRRLRQTKELLRMHTEIAGISETGGKAGVMSYLSDNFDTGPIVRGNVILIGPVAIFFDENEDFLRISDDDVP
ncbi:MAG: hypothetical protein ACR2Q3_10645 [Woeseiaceae bacterium]